MLVRSSFLSVMKSCFAKAFYRHELGLVPLNHGVRNDLAFGRVVHDAIEIFHDSNLAKASAFIEAEDFSETQRKNKQTAKALLTAYARDIGSIEVEETELEFEYAIGKHVWKGRFDGIGHYGGETWVIEHKTTNPYYLFAKPNDQFIAYWIGAGQLYNDVAGVILNNLDCDKLRLYRSYIRYSQSEREEWLDEIQTTLDLYEFCRKRGVFPRNPGSCLLYNSRCPYFPICSEPESTRDLIIARCYEKNEGLVNLEW